MPELPEVETIRRELEPALLGTRVRSVWTSGFALRLGRPVDRDALVAACVGHRVRAVLRRAKYLVIEFDEPHRIVVHLGMSGRLLLVDARTPRPAHTHVVFALDGARELRYVDPRRFGLVAADAPELAALGLDPFDPALTGERMHKLTRATRRAVKEFLLDQRGVVGVGNIYACEALHVARIHPKTPASRLSRARATVLRDAIRAVLTQGLANRGTTLRDYVSAGGAIGDNQSHLRVYDRAGRPCPRPGCGQVRRLPNQARGTFYCPRCQCR